MVARERTVAFSARTMSTAARWIEVSISSAGTNYIWSSIPDRQIKQIGIHTQTRTKTHAETHTPRLKLSPAANANKWSLLMFGLKLTTVGPDTQITLAYNSYTLTDCVWDMTIAKVKGIVRYFETYRLFVCFQEIDTTICTVNMKLETGGS